MIKKTKGTPDPIDKHVGHRLRIRRALMGMSQEKMAEYVGVTFQQIQKYERGMNRVSAGRLFQLSKVLEVPVSYFFDEVGEDSMPSYALTGMADNEQSPFGGEEDIMERKETLDLIRSYYAITDEKVRQNMLKLIKSMAREEKE